MKPMLKIAKMPKELYQLEGITKEYQSGKVRFKALHGIDLSIRSGEVVALTGPSGSGKSTLLNILGMVEKPTEGAISFTGHELGKLKDTDITNIRRDAVGFIFQNFNLMPVLSALENVEYPLILEGTYSKKEMRERAFHALNSLGLGKYATHKPAELSGGQRQRVAIARAIVKEPKVVIADEPTANLDSKTATQIMDMISHLNEQWKTTVIVATHDKELSERCHKVVKIRDGLIRSVH